MTWRKIVRFLSLLLLIMLPFDALIICVWIMLHEPFEEVARTALVIMVILEILRMWVEAYADYKEEP